MSEDCEVTVIVTYVKEKVTFVTVISQGFFWSLLLVMAGHSRSKNGVASLAYVSAIHVLLSCSEKDVDARNKCGHDGIR
jgi:hypothetical protein